ncbi:MAG: GGDEF domain-containing protein [Nocardioidaceae bacterium]
MTTHGATDHRRSPAMPVLTPDMGFDIAAELVLDYLNAHVPMALWSVTRVENDRQTFLFVDPDNPYDIRPGGSHPWEDSFCIRMASGRGPTVAPDAQSVPAYAAAKVNAVARIGAYGGAVIQEPGGRVFGAICGIDPDAKSLSSTLATAGPLLSLLGQLLTMVVSAERLRDQAASAALKATLAAETDGLTGLFNRRAWQRICEDEEMRFQRLADPTVAVVLDLDLLKEVNDSRGHAAGDLYIQLAGSSLRDTVKASDVVARLGGDEFGVLLRGCTETEAAAVVNRMYAALAACGVAGSIGWAPITVLQGFPAALAEADAAMYAAKAERRRSRVKVSPG